MHLEFLAVIYKFQKNTGDSGVCVCVKTVNSRLTSTSIHSGKSLQSCPTLCDPMDCSPPDSSDHGMLQARILEWVDIPFSMGSS